jgi:peptidoglycan/LPS O-acetylase OafA/YrhL
VRHESTLFSYKYCNLASFPISEGNKVTIRPLMSPGDKNSEFHIFSFIPRRPFVKSEAFFIYFFIFFGLLLGILEEANLQFSEGKFFGNIDPNYSQISRAFLGFGLGLLLYAKNGQKSSKKVTRAPSVKSLSLICFFLCVEYALVVYSSKFIYFASPIFYFLIKLIIGIDQGIFPQWMLTVCSKLGRISYGVYVFHTPVSQLFSGEFFTKYLGFNLIEPQFLILGFILKLLLTIIVAELSLRLVEIPMKKWSKW